MQKIVPCLWFDHNAVEAVAFYTSVFPDARVTATHHYPSEGLPDFQQEFAGKELTIEFEISDFRFVAVNAGPEFTINPSVSFMLNFDPGRDAAARDELDLLWEALSEGGETIMPLGRYPFSERYGWVRDRFGVSWQVILSNPEGDPRPFVIPNLSFGDGVQNRAAEALEYYGHVFGGSQVGTIARYPEQTGPARAGDVMFSDIRLLGQWFALMDSGQQLDFTFNCGVSLMLECGGQPEIDRYWAQLSAVPEAEQCGWCADRFGVSWQVVPVNLGDLMQAPGSYQKLLEMKKIEVDAFR